jgi:hypothetical protein
MVTYGRPVPQGSTRRIVMWFAATVVVLALLFSYRTSTGGAAPAPRAQPPGVVGAPGPVTRTPRPGSSGGGSGGQNTVVNGSVAQTRWGPVQVQVTIAGGRITDVQTLIYPSGNGHDAAINAYALPQLRQEVLDAQSAQIDAVSGATVTSDGYRESLQAALDAAHFNG